LFGNELIQLLLLALSVAMYIPSLAGQASVHR
jgi:hypothetical protein